MPITETQPQNGLRLPSAPAPGPENAETDNFSFRALHQVNERSMADQQPELEATMARATSMLFTFVPELRAVHSRDNLNVLVVDDIKATIKSLTGKDRDGFGESDPSGYTHTTVDPATGQATGTTIYLDRKIFSATRLNDGNTYEGVTQVLAVLSHELQHCRQPQHPQVGRPVVQMDHAAAEIDAYQAEARAIEKVFTGVNGMKVEEYRKRFSDGNLDGEKIVDEMINLRMLSGYVSSFAQKFRAQHEAQTMPQLPAAAADPNAILIPGMKTGSAPFAIPPNSPYAKAIQESLDTGLTVRGTGEDRVPFKIYNKEGQFLRDVFRSNANDTPEEMHQVLALQLQAARDFENLVGILNRQGWGFRALPHEVGQPNRVFEILERAPGTTGNAPENFVVRTTVSIRPSDANRAVLEIGADLYQAWESDLLREVKELIPQDPRRE